MTDTLVTCIDMLPMNTQIGRCVHLVDEKLRSAGVSNRLTVDAMTAEENWHWTQIVFEESVIRFKREMSVPVTVEGLKTPRGQYAKVKRISTRSARIAQRTLDVSLAAVLSQSAGLLERLGAVTAALNQATANVVWKDVTWNTDKNRPSKDREARKWATRNFIKDYPNHADLSRLLTWRHKRTHEGHLHTLMDEFPRRIIFAEGFPYHNPNLHTFSYGQICECLFELWHFLYYWQERTRTEIEDRQYNPRFDQWHLPR